MKTLFILRHAKSSWGNSDLADFDRPLNERGLEAAPLMGNVIYENQFQPDLIISSPAKRAKQTAVLVRASAQLESKIQYDEKIYEASPRRLLQIVSEQNDKLESLMLVGHNPGFEELVKNLTGEFQTMPTATLAVIDLQIDSWSEAESNCGTLRVLIRPKDQTKTPSFD